jgi:glycerol-3-phosphate acyltransferase PlsY
MEMEEVYNSFHLLAIFAAYLMGSIPSAVWIGKAFYQTDVRQYGSGNAGATNTFRVLGKKPGVTVLILDALKGFFAVWIFSDMTPLNHKDDIFTMFQLALAVAVTIGHIFPVFANFKGGKGVATLMGVIIALHWQAALLSIAIFLIVFLLTGYVSLGSMIAGISFPFHLFIFFRPEPLPLIHFSMIIAIVVLFTHQKNIERLLRKEENRVPVRRKNK